MFSEIRNKKNYNLTPENEKIYNNHEHALRVHRSLVGCILGSILMPAGFFLDYFVYPELLNRFLFLRFLCSVLILLVLFLHFNKKVAKYINYLIFAWAILLQAFICYMIYITEQYNSTYYAGLSMTILAVGILLPLKAREIILFGFISILLYVTACTSSIIISNSYFFNNIYFLLLSIIISSVSGYFNSKKRIDTFILNQELEDKNHELQKNLERSNRLQKNLHEANLELKETISKLNQVKLQLIQSEKINAIGNLSAGILHEINNPLNYSLAALQVIKNDAVVIESEDLMEMLGDVEEGMGRISTITSDLHSFAHPSEAKKKTKFLLNDAIESALKFTAHLYNNIRLEKMIKESVIVVASKTNIVQVFINLLSNAVYAIEKSKNLDKGKIIVEVERYNDKAKIKILDNGIGIKKDKINSIFNPFFTTKEVGSGTGLGLSITQSIIKSHNSILSVKSVYNEGAEFSFELPLEL